MVPETKTIWEGKVWLQNVLRPLSGSEVLALPITDSPVV